jgi:hypothetical protein
MDVKYIGNVEDNYIICIMPLFSVPSVPIPICCSYMYTLLGGVRSEADVARFYCTNKEQIFEESCKDIDTVRNIEI